MNARHLRLVASNDATTPGDSLGDLTKRAAFDRTVDTRGAESEPLRVEDLYPAADDLVSPLQSVLRLLADVADNLSEALTATRDERMFEADNAVMHSTRILRELFAHRALGDGFGAVINACLQATRNRSDVLATEQLSVLRGVVLKLRSLPNISFDSATDLVMQIEDAGLNVDPPGFDELTELLAN